MVDVGPNFKEFETCWLALLCTPGTLLFKRGATADEIGYVLSASHICANLWHVKPKKVDGVMLLDFHHIIFATRWKHQKVTDLKDWVVQDTAVRTPTEASTCAAALKFAKGLAITVPENRVVPLLRHSAERGFKPLTCEYLKRLIIYLEHPVAKNADYRV